LISIVVSLTRALAELDDRRVRISLWSTGSQELSASAQLTIEEAVRLAEQLAEVLDESRRIAS